MCTEEQRKRQDPRDAGRVRIHHDTLYHISLGMQFNQIPEDVLEKLKEEKGFDLEENAYSYQELDVASKRLVGLGKKPCPSCNGTGTVNPRHRGQKTQVPVWLPDQCICLAYKKSFLTLGGPYGCSS